MSTVNIILDGKPILVDSGKYVLDVCRDQGLDIPAPCRWPFLDPRPVCKLCQVEVKSAAGEQSKCLTSCDLRVSEGMEVQTQSPAAVEARKQALLNIMKRTAPTELFTRMAGEMGVPAEFGDDSVTCFRCMLCVRACEELGPDALSLKKVKPGETSPVYVDETKCILCGACAVICPVQHIRLEDHANRQILQHDLRLGPNAAITLTFRQAVPNVPRIHTEDCIHFNGGECDVCAVVCPKECIHYDEEDHFEEVDVGTVIMATGFQDFDPTPMKQFGHGKLPNVISALEFEQMNNAASPTGGKIVMEDGTEPRSIAILHCIGSRDEHHHKYCSRVCCMYALKFAHLVKEKTSAEVYQLYIDLRAFGKGYEEFYQRILDEGVNVIRGKGAEVVLATRRRADEGHLLVRCEDTLIGKFREIPVDMVILCTALEARSDAAEIARKFNISTGADGWFIEAHPKLAPVSTTTEGIFLAGVCQGPKDIPDTVAQGGAAAAQAMKLMNVGELMMDAAYAEIIDDLCSGCRICNGLCPYQAISYDEEKKISHVNAALCKACGTCVAACPAGAIKGRHFTDEQIYAQMEGMLA
jgi:heterodisulfide reductase subunit A